MSNYKKALAAARRNRSANLSDDAAMALYCDSALQAMVGAASPELVWVGAQKKGMTTPELMTLAKNDPAAVHELMWV